MTRVARLSFQKLALILFCIFFISCFDLPKEEAHFVRYNKNIFLTCVKNHEFVIFSSNGGGGGITQHFGSDNKPIPCEDFK
jgi:hypothetical protein